MSNLPAPTETARFPEDILPGGFARWEIDRDSMNLSGDIARAFGDAEGPVQLTAEALRCSGKAAIFDGGCGTGRALWDVASRGARIGDGTPPYAAGLNSRDYSQESELVEVRRANRQREIDYRLGQLEAIPFGADTFDVAWSYEVLVHCPRTAPRIVSELIRVVKPGGIIFCNMDGTQLEEPAMLNALGEAGGPVEAMKLMSNGWRHKEPQVRAICRIAKA